MKPPRWLRLEVVGGELRVAVRRWHPAYWLAVWRALSIEIHINLDQDKLLGRE